MLDRHWVTVFDIHQVSAWAGFTLAVFLALLAVACAWAAAVLWLPPTDAGSRRFSAALAGVGVVFVWFAISAVMDAHGVERAKALLEAGDVVTREGEVAAVSRWVRGSRYGVLGPGFSDSRPGPAFAFRLGGQWFVSPVARLCRMEVGAKIRVRFLPLERGRVTPVIVRLEMAEAC